MAQRRHHYERAFERYLRANRIPYIAVDEARKALLPEGKGPEALKSFDFVVYQRRRNLLLDVKGRRIANRAGGAPRVDPWVTEEDIESLGAWARLFGSAFAPAFVFCCWCDACPASALFEEIFEHEGRWYALRAVSLESYRAEMRSRSPRWGTVCVPARRFEAISQPFAELADSLAAGALRGNMPPSAFGEPSAGSPGRPVGAGRER